MPAQDPAFKKTIVVPPDVIDGNGHVNNVAYVQWMQDIAIEHYASVVTSDQLHPGETWVAREHRIEYLAPAFEGDALEAKTWVVNLRRVRSARRYLFTRVSDGKLVVRGETDWVFVDATTGAPRSIPPEVVRLMPVSPDANARRAP